MDKKYPTTDKGHSEADPHWEEWRSAPAKLSDLRRKLYLKAKREPKFRFYALYDRIYRKDVLRFALRLVAQKKGAPGIDGVTIDQIVASEDGSKSFVDVLHDELRLKQYKPQPIRRVMIPKAGGGQRPLGIPTVKDRVAQMAALLVLEPIFEADFLDCSYGFRPNKSAHQAMDKIRALLKAGYQEIYDADLKGYFDSIPHDKLMDAVRVRVVDRAVLKLIRMWLQAPIVEEGQGGAAERNRQGTPQGGVLSPLLANLYLHWFDHFFYKESGLTKCGAELVRYADDFVILMKKLTKEAKEWVEGTLEGRMGLVINRDKTSIVRLGKLEKLDFLGFTCRLDKDLKRAGRRYVNVVPSKESEARFRETLREVLSARTSFMGIAEVIKVVNRKLKGWKNYFDFGYPRASFRGMNNYVRLRFMQHLNRRSQRRYRPPAGISIYRHLRDLGLFSL